MTARGRKTTGATLAVLIGIGLLAAASWGEAAWMIHMYWNGRRHTEALRQAHAIKAGDNRYAGIPELTRGLSETSPLVIILGLCWWGAIRATALAVIDAIGSAHRARRRSAHARNRTANQRRRRRR